MDKKNLLQLKPGQSGLIYGMAGGSDLKRRLIDMGIIPGTEIQICKVAPLGDPIEVRLRGYQLSIRRADAANIFLMTEDEAQNFLLKQQALMLEREKRGKRFLKKSPTRTDPTLKSMKGPQGLPSL